MHDKIITISPRGQLTLPKKLRAQIPVKHFICEVKNGQYILKPLQTREDFFAELEKDEADWKKNGGYTLDDLQKKYKL